MATQMEIGKKQTNWLKQILLGDTNTVAVYMQAGFKIESNTASSFSCLVAVKLVTSPSLETFSLTGFDQDES